jgi:hypothetical protein
MPCLKALKKATLLKTILFIIIINLLPENPLFTGVAAEMAHTFGQLAALRNDAI